MDNAQGRTVNQEHITSIEQLVKLYTLTELSQVLKVSHRTLLTYVKEGRLKAVLIGGKWKVSEANLLKFVNGDT